MFLKKESFNRIFVVFDPKTDLSTKIKKEYDGNLECKFF